MYLLCCYSPLLYQFDVPVSKFHLHHKWTMPTVKKEMSSSNTILPIRCKTRQSINRVQNYYAACAALPKGLVVANHTNKKACLFERQYRFLINGNIVERSLKVCHILYTVFFYPLMVTFQNFLRLQRVALPVINM